MENARILIANTAMDTDKIKVFGSKVRVHSTAKVAELEQAEKVCAENSGGHTQCNCMQCILMYATQSGTDIHMYMRCTPMCVHMDGHTHTCTHTRTHTHTHNTHTHTHKHVRVWYIRTYMNAHACTLQTGRDGREHTHTHEQYAFVPT